MLNIFSFSEFYMIIYISIETELNIGYNNMILVIVNTAASILLCLV